MISCKLISLESEDEHQDVNAWERCPLIAQHQNYVNARVKGEQRNCMLRLGISTIATTVIEVDYNFALIMGGSEHC